MKCISVKFSEMSFRFKTTRDWAFVKFDNDQMSFCIKKTGQAFDVIDHMSNVLSFAKKISQESSLNELMFNFLPLPISGGYPPQKAVQWQY